MFTLIRNQADTARLTCKNLHTLNRKTIHIDKLSNDKFKHQPHKIGKNYTVINKLQNDSPLKHKILKNSHDKQKNRQNQVHIQKKGLKFTRLYTQQQHTNAILIPQSDFRKSLPINRKQRTDRLYPNVLKNCKNKNTGKKCLMDSTMNQENINKFNISQHNDVPHIKDKYRISYHKTADEDQQSSKNIKRSHIKNAKIQKSHMNKSKIISQDSFFMIQKQTTFDEEIDKFFQINFRQNKQIQNFKEQNKSIQIVRKQHDKLLKEQKSKVYQTHQNAKLQTGEQYISLTSSKLLLIIGLAILLVFIQLIK